MLIRLSLQLINPQSVDLLLLLLLRGMGLGVIDMSTRGRVGGPILLPDALQVELSSIGKDNR